MPNLYTCVLKFYDSDDFFSEEAFHNSCEEFDSDDFFSEEVACVKYFNYVITETAEDAKAQTLEFYKDKKAKAKAKAKTKAEAKIEVEDAYLVFVYSRLAEAVRDRNGFDRDHVFASFLDYASKNLVVRPALGYGSFE
jgi:hypothetical protein